MEIKFDELLDKLGVDLSYKVHSYVHCCQEAKVYGILWNLKTKMCSIPDKKLNKFKKFILLSMKYRTVTGAVLDYIAGNILYFSQLNPLAKILVWKIMKYITFNLRSELYSKYDILLLPLDIIKDLKFWFIYIDLVSNIPIINILNNPKISIYASSDASQNFGGWIIGNKWSFYEFSEIDKKQFHINQKEFHCILSLLNTLKHELTGKKIHISIDNNTAVTGIKRKWSKTHNIMMFVYELCHIMIKYKILIYVDWISSATNVLSDALTRFQDDKSYMNLFWNTIKLHNYKIDKKPTPTIYFNDYLFTNKLIDDKFSVKDEYVEFIKYINLPFEIRKNKSYNNYGKKFSVYNII